MAYSATTDIAAIYGTTNRDKWADLDNDGSPDTGVIAAWIVKADAEIEDRLRRTHYAIPLADSDDATPATITWISAALAGGIGYLARGVEDDSSEALKYMAVARQMLEEIANGQRWITAVAHGN